MRESRTYGSVRGACDETHVPTATAAHVHRGFGGTAALPLVAVLIDADNRGAQERLATFRSCRTGGRHRHPTVAIGRRGKRGFPL